ncbi:MAG TPA: hypothetical protein VIL16_12510 [Trebonia sp.]
MSIPTGRAFAKALEEAGVVTDLNTVQRIVIDINGWDAVHVYVERIGDSRLLDAFKGPLGMMLAENAPEPEPVRYWVMVADELLGDPVAVKGLEEAGLRIARVGGRVDRYSQKVLIEDPQAPRELDGHDVELTFHREADGPVTVERRVTA